MPIEIERLRPERAREWGEFLRTSNNGTIFHDLDFLSYHPAGRFDEHHLLFHREGKLVAVMPAALVTGADGRKYLASPYGASVGGPALPPSLESGELINLVHALQSYARDFGLQGIRMRLGPSVYLKRQEETLGFALFASGFRQSARWLCFIVEISDGTGALRPDVLSSRKMANIRRGLRKGLLPREVDATQLEVFYRLLSESMHRHRAVATHSLEELKRLFELVPGRLRLFLCRDQGREIAGVLVFMLNEVSAYTFYISGHNEGQGNAVLLHHVMHSLAREGIRYLDMGPSASSLHFNEGGVNFKEKMGARGHCRDEWVWECDAARETTSTGEEAKWST